MPSATEFTDAVATALRERGAGDVEVLPEPFAVRCDGTTFFLASAYQRYCDAWPWQRRRVIDRFLELSEVPLGGGAWAEIASRVVPTVRDRFYVQTIHYLDEANGRQPREIPLEVLTDRLCVTLAVDQGDSFVLVTGAMLEEWSVTFEVALGEARENLRRRTTEEVSAVVADRIFEGRWGDGNCASRLLLDDSTRGLPVRGLPTFVVPARASFLVTGSDDEDGIAALLRFLESSEEVEQPVSRIPVVRRWPEYESMALPESHPLFPALQRQVVRDWGDVYQGQQDLLHRVLEQRHDQAAVAPYLLYQPDDHTQAPQSFTTWFPGQPTLLPRVDQVAFVDPDRGGGEVLGMVDWHTVGEFVPLEQGRTGDYPVRYRMEQFPEASVLQAMLRAGEERALLERTAVDGEVS